MRQKHELQRPGNTINHRQYRGASRRMQHHASREKGGGRKKRGVGGGGCESRSCGASDEVEGRAFVTHRVAGDAGAAADYDWIVLELYDQAARKFKGGLMGRHLKSAGLANEDFIKARIGAEMWDTVRQEGHGPATGLMARASRLTLRYVLRRLRERMAGAMVGIIAGGWAREAFKEGTFRARGEVHRWMYDRYSLGRLMMESGLRDVGVCGATESRIAGLADYGLDVRNGEERKPDSIYMEGLS